MKKNNKNSEITEFIVVKMIENQFPHLTHLTIKAVEFGGHDNRTFRLGDDLLIRLPSAESYALKVPKEQKWLPFLASNLPLPIPTPVFMGKPSNDYPFNWSIYRWIEGKSANSLKKEELDFVSIALDLAKFLNALYNVDTNDALMQDNLLPGKHNFFRGAHPSVYDLETRLAIKRLEEFIDSDRATALWEKAISSKLSKDPVWIHGDVASGNIIIKDKKLAAVIDFGGMGIGDPACDLVINWTFFENEARKKFKKHIELDSDTWDRARGWALWKALITLDKLEDKNSFESLKQKKIIEEVLSE